MSHHTIGKRIIAPGDRLFETLNVFTIAFGALTYTQFRWEGKNPKIDAGATMTLVSNQFPLQIVFPMFGPLGNALRQLPPIPIELEIEAKTLIIPPTIPAFDRLVIQLVSQ